MDVALAVVFTVVFIINIACSVWSTKKNCKETRLKATAIYALYEQLKRYNDNVFGGNAGESK